MKPTNPDSGPGTPDSVLLDELRALYDVLDPVPDEVLAGARGALAWRTIDAELAALTFDTATAGAGSVRSAAAPRLLTFEAAGLTVEVEVAATGDTRRLVGQLVPPSPGQVTVESPTGSLVIAADELGRFAADAVPAGPLRLQCVLGEGVAPVVTSWLVI